MADQITDYDDIPLVGTLTKARDNSIPRTIENQLLDGTFNVQTVGTEATEVDVEFVCEEDVRRDLEDYAAESALLKVTRNTKRWTGHIKGGKINWDWFSYDEQTVKFTLLVLTEEDV